MNMGWTEDRVCTLRKLWTEGLSASQIAKQLGGVTRNAIIGKVHRLGLAARATPTRPAMPRPQRPARPRAITLSPPRPRPAPLPAPAFEPPPVLEPLQMADGRAADVLSLSQNMCKFPIGDPAQSGFAFCGRQSVCGPYCSAHARLAYQPSLARRRRA